MVKAKMPISVHAYRPAKARAREEEPKTKEAPAIEDKRRCVDVLYENWRGEKRFRTIKPIEVEFTSTQWHPVKQWLLRARDMEDGKVKHFAMKDIYAWAPFVPGTTHGRRSSEDKE